MLSSPEKTATTVAVATAAGAVLCGVCCVLPFALPAVMLATSGGVLAWFGSAQSWATTAATVIVGVAWIWVGATSATAKKWPARSTIYAMAFATLVLSLAIVWPRIEPYIIASLKG